MKKNTIITWAIESVHPIDECPECDAASDKAIDIARVTGSAVGRYCDSGYHAALVTREERPVKQVIVAVP